MTKMAFTLPLPAVGAVGAVGKVAGEVRKDPKGKRHGVGADEALELAGFGKFNAIMLLYCGCLMLGMILETLGFSYVLPAAHCDLRLSHDAQGWVAAIPFAGFILTSHAWGWLADAYGRRRALMLSTSVGAAFSLLSSLAPELYSFVVLRFCAALFIAGGAALGYAFLGEFSPAPHRDKMVALANASVALGTAVVPLVAWAVLPADFTWAYAGASYRPWRLLVCCFALPYVVCALAGTRVPESPKFLAGRGRRDEAMRVLTDIYRLNTGGHADDYQVGSLADESTAASRAPPSISSMWKLTAAMFRGPLLASSLQLCFLQFVSFAISNGFYIWLPAVMNRVWSGDVRNSSGNLCSLITIINTTVSTTEEECDDSLRTEAFVVTIAIASFITVFTVAVAFSVKLVGKKSILVGIFGVAAACSLALHWTTDTVTAVLFFCSFQLCSTTIGLVNAYVVQIYPTHFRAMAVCVAMLCGRVGSMVFSKGVGSLLLLHCPSCFFLSAALLAMSAGVTLLLPGDAATPPPAPTAAAASAAAPAPAAAAVGDSAA